MNFGKYKLQLSRLLGFVDNKTSLMIGLSAVSKTFTLSSMATKNLNASHILILLCFVLLPFVNSLNYPAVFNFGDSNSDTGELTAGIGFRLPYPYGELYFNASSSSGGRFSDGRLIIDFLMAAMSLPFLDPYLDSVGMPSFHNGCNFAAGGATILRATAASICPFSFGVQVSQFSRFKARALQLLAARGKELENFLPSEDSFQKGLYVFDIGQNDLAGAFYSKTLDQILAFIPTILAEFELGIQRLYDQGARNFWIHNTGPLGCLTQNVATFGTDPSKLDAQGCVSAHNQAAKTFNLQLHDLSKKFQAQYSDANVTFVDIFSIKFDLIANYSQYGFQQPIMTCCGYGGPPLNYNNRVSCGTTRNLNGTSATAKGCSNSTVYVSWDGIHYTEAANQFVSSKILTGKYSDPPLSDNISFISSFKNRIW